MSVRTTLGLDDRLRSVMQAHPALHTEIASLDLLDDSALWNAAKTRMPQSASEQMEVLHRKQRLTGLSDFEAEELTRLENQYERVILVRSHSAWLLGQRGHDIRSLGDPDESLEIHESLRSRLRAQQ